MWLLLEMYWCDISSAHLTGIGGRTHELVHRSTITIEYVLCKQKFENKYFYAQNSKAIQSTFGMKTRKKNTYARNKKRYTFARNKWEWDFKRFSLPFMVFGHTQPFNNASDRERPIFHFIINLKRNNVFFSCFSSKKTSLCEWNTHANAHHRKIACQFRPFVLALSLSLSPTSLFIINNVKTHAWKVKSLSENHVIFGCVIINNLSGVIKTWLLL